MISSKGGLYMGVNVHVMCKYKCKRVILIVMGFLGSVLIGI
jgi:hypothetical protein